MDYRDFEYAVRVVDDINETLRGVDLGAVERAADTAASVVNTVEDLVTVGDVVTRPFVAARQPRCFEAASVFIGARQPSLGALDGLVDGCQSAWDGLSAATAAVGSVSQAAEFLAQPVEIPSISTANSIADAMGSVAEATRVATDWKLVLTQFAPPLEAAFATRLSEIERTIYSAIRPEILSVADQLSRTFELSPQNTFVDYMGTLFELDFGLNPELDLDAPPTDELPGVAPQRPRWLGSRRLVVWLADRPIVVELMGVATGEVAGTGTGLMIDGTTGALIGNGLGGVLGVALGKGLVVVVKRCRARL